MWTSLKRNIDKSAKNECKNEIFFPFKLLFTVNSISNLYEQFFQKHSKSWTNFAANRNIVMSCRSYNLINHIELDVILFESNLCNHWIWWAFLLASYISKRKYGIFRLIHSTCTRCQYDTNEMRVFISDFGVIRMVC